MGDKTIPDSAEPRLESFYPPFVAGIDLPHQGVVDSYNLQCVSNGDNAVLHEAIDIYAVRRKDHESYGDHFKCIRQSILKHY